MSKDSNRLNQLKSIYLFVRDSFNNINESTFESENIRSIFKNRKGNSFGLNLLLTAMLRRADFESEPILIATKNNECLNPVLATTSSIDYLTCKVSLDGIDYYLDASHKYLPFNQLPENCYNGMARTVNKIGQNIYLESKALLDKNICVVTVSPAEDSKLQISITVTLGSITAYNLRSSWKADTIAAMSFIDKNLASDIPLLHLLNKQIRNISDPELPLKIVLDGILDLGTTDVIYFNPFLKKFFKKNPFESLSRHYPIDFNNVENSTYVLMLKLPEGYEINDVPNSSVLTFEGEGNIEFENLLNHNKDQNTLKIQSHFITNATHFSASSYVELRKFYGDVLEEQNKSIVIKKIK